MAWPCAMAERLKTGNMSMLCPKMKRAIFSLLNIWPSQYVPAHPHCHALAILFPKATFYDRGPAGCGVGRQTGGSVYSSVAPRENLAEFCRRPTGDCYKLRDFHGGRRRAGANLSLVSKSKCLKSEVIELGVRQKADFNCSFSNIFFQ